VKPRQRQTNGRVAAVVGLACMLLVVMGAFRADRLPFIGSAGTTYSAAFTDSTGLREGDPVEVAGVDVGLVKSLQIRSDHVVVVFTLDGRMRLGTTTRARIKIGSLLGAKYLDISPSGPGQMDPESTIPIKRTRPAYDVLAAFGDLARTEQRLDTTTIAKALDTISETLSGAAPEVRESIRGLTRFATTIASRDAALRSLFKHADSVTGVLDEHSQRIVSLIGATDTLLAELSAREQLIHDLLVHTRSLSVQLDELIGENQRELTPALAQLNKVTETLISHQQDLRDTIRSLDNYARVFTNVVGSGPWFDAFIPTLPVTPNVAKR
jgi:phospholipid/cholesterol/gamma-HCH transport system substrate-binding protein